MILPKVRDPRLIIMRRGGTLTDDDHHLLATWAADCAERVQLEAALDERLGRPALPHRGTQCKGAAMAPTP